MLILSVLRLFRCCCCTLHRDPLKNHSARVFQFYENDKRELNGFRFNETLTGFNASKPPFNRFVVLGAH